MIIKSSAPTRVDLAGGTIDIPPLFLFHEGAATVNFAIDLLAKCRIESRDDDRIIRTGACSGGADWKLKVKTDDGRLEVEGEIDSNVAGQRWRWTLRHNGSLSDRGVGTTTARSGSFEVERKVVDLGGTDTLVFRAVRDGQVCRGVVNY